MMWHVMCHVNSLQDLSGLILLFDHPIDECHIIWDKKFWMCSTTLICKLMVLNEVL